VWQVDVNALTLSVGENQVINFTDRYGKVQFHIPTPIMWDSSGVAGQSGRAEKNLTTRVWRQNGQWMLSLSADYGWLNDPARAYPVMVDPTVNIGSVTTNAYKSDGSYRSDAVQVGNSRNSGGDC
jgi:hypothetical protein